MPARSPAQEMPQTSATTPVELPPPLQPDSQNDNPVQAPTASRRRRTIPTPGGTVAIGPVSFAVTPSQRSQRDAIVAAVGLTDEERNGLQALDDVERNCTLQAISSLASQAERSIVLAKAISRVEAALEPFRSTIESLKNTPLGFMLDKPEQYDWPVLRRVVAEAMLRGARISGNEFNGISKRCYLTKAYYVRKCREWPGVTILQDIFGIPRVVNSQTVVDYKIVYTRRVTTPSETISEESYERTGNNAIPIRVNDGMGADAIIGKATRKAYAGLLEQLISRSGQSWSPGSDGEIDDAPQMRQVTNEAAALPTGQNHPGLDGLLTEISGIIQTAPPTELASIGRRLVDASQAMTAMWTSQQRRRFHEVFSEWVSRRCATATDRVIIEATGRTVEAIGRIHPMEQHYIDLINRHITEANRRLTS